MWPLYPESPKRHSIFSLSSSIYFRVDAAVLAIVLDLFSVILEIHFRTERIMCVRKVVRERINSLGRNDVCNEVLRDFGYCYRSSFQT